MNKEDLKELWNIVFDIDSELLELSSSSEKAHLIACDVHNDYFGTSTLTPQNEGLFISQYGEIQIKTAVITDYTYETKKNVSKLEELNDKLSDWYKRHTNG